MTASGLFIPDLAGKAVLITGGSTGRCGRSPRLCRARRAGRHRLPFERRPSPRACERDQGRGGEALAVKGDVADPKECAQIVAETASRFGGLDGLINNAGLMLGRVHSLEASDEHVQAVIDLNARSIIWVTRAAAPWLERQGGFVINTTSIAARNGGAGGAMIYAAAKPSFRRSPRSRQGADRQEIRVNAVSPGVIATPFHERYTDAVHWRAFARRFPSRGSEPPKIAWAPICSSRPRP